MSHTTLDPIRGTKLFRALTEVFGTDPRETSMEDLMPMALALYAHVGEQTGIEGMKPVETILRVAVNAHELVLTMEDDDG